jgi:hypothetical protein
MKMDTDTGTATDMGMATPTIFFFTSNQYHQNFVTLNKKVVFSNSSTIYTMLKILGKHPGWF